ncbi:MAG: hypothetical protein ABSH34_14720 [Verrucomicrobiota bacterium]|jgi:hypothetical protein
MIAAELESPRWQAVGLVLDQNARDLQAGRYGRIPEIVSWFKAIDLFRQAELERMIERKPTPVDRRCHKTWLAALIAEGERLLTDVRRSASLPRNTAGIKLSDLEATVEELYDTHAEWHGSLKPNRRAAIFRQLFDAPESWREERARLSRTR